LGEGTIEARLAVVELRVLHALELLEAHMEREEKTTATILTMLESMNTRLHTVEQKLSSWVGTAIGISLAVSTIWALLLAAWALFK
jgi:hypothetical protein